MNYYTFTPFGMKEYSHGNYCHKEDYLLLKTDRDSLEYHLREMTDKAVKLERHNKRLQKIVALMNEKDEDENNDIKKKYSSYKTSEKIDFLRELFDLNQYTNEFSISVNSAYHSIRITTDSEFK